MRIDKLPASSSESASTTTTSNSSLLSYLSLLGNLSSDPTRAHRTQPFSSSTTRVYSGSSVSLEYIRHPSNLLARSNPIGLAEPSIKRDGWASSRSSLCGSVQSVVHCFDQMTEQLPRERSASVVSNVSNASNASDACGVSRSGSVERKLSGCGNVRLGSGLIGTGRPVNNSNFFRPFGNSFPNNNNINSINNGNSMNNMGDAKKPPTAPKRTLRGVKKSNKGEDKTAEDNNEAETKGMTNNNAMSNGNKNENTKNNNKKNTEKKIKSKKEKLITPFAAVDIMLASSQPQTQPRRTQRRRRRSTTMTTTTTSSSETEVTVSLPPTRRASRQASVEPMSRCNSSTTVQIFNGVYTIRVPRKKRASSEVLELEATFSTAELNKDADSWADLEAKAALNKMDKKEENKAGYEERMKDEEKEKKDKLSKDDKEGGNNLKLANKSDRKTVEGNNSEPTSEVLNKTTTSAQNGLAKISNKEQKSENIASKEKKEEVLCSNVNNENLEETINIEKRGESTASNKNGDALNSERNKVIIEDKCIDNNEEKNNNNVDDSKNYTNVEENDQLSNSNAVEIAKSSIDTAVLEKSAKNASIINAILAASKDPKEATSKEEDIKYEVVKYDEDKICNKVDPDTTTDSSLHESNGKKADLEASIEKSQSSNESEEGQGSLENGQVDQEEQTSEMSLPLSTVLTSSTLAEFCRRRQHVYTHGWEEHEHWFLQSDFRAWWQLNGCIGVPLYKIYKRKSQWRTEIIIDDEDEEEDDFGIRSFRETKKDEQQEKKTDEKRDEKEDSVERILRRIRESRERRERLLQRGDSYEDGEEEKRSRESNNDRNDNNDAEENKHEDDNEDSTEANNETKRPRTFSETLKMLDPDIAADLDLQ